jgi:hypothetical protein
MNSGDNKDNSLVTSEVIPGLAAGAHKRNVLILLCYMLLAIVMGTMLWL